MSISLGAQSSGTSGQIKANGSKVTVTSGTRVQFPSHTSIEVFIVAQAANTGYVYVGNSNVSSTVYIQRLSSGESAVLSVTDSSEIYIDTSVDAEGIVYTVIG